MLSVRNLTDFDYGCTSVSINREGSGAAQFWDDDPVNFMASKTFAIRSTNNDPLGAYSVSLYYTAAEIDGWEAATGRMPADLVVIKSDGDFTQPMESGLVFNLNSATTFGEGYAYHATFSGFAQFGIGPMQEVYVNCEENVVSGVVRSNDRVLLEVSSNITSTETIADSAKVSYSAGASIDLLPGFSVEAGTEFDAYILGCFPAIQE